MDETWTLIHWNSLALDVAAMMSSSGRCDQPINRQLRESVSDHDVDQSRATEARNPERFGR
jgi:hypothetical protein